MKHWLWCVLQSFSGLNSMTLDIFDREELSFIVLHMRELFIFRQMRIGIIKLSSNILHFVIPMP